MQERVDYFSFLDCSSPFCFFLIKFRCPFSISYKILPYYVYYYCILKEYSVTPLRLILFVFALHISLLTPFYIRTSSVSVSYFILAVPMRSVWENTLAWVHHFLVILKRTCFFLESCFSSIECNLLFTLSYRIDFVLVW